jgi:hypothetical protein
MPLLSGLPTVVTRNTDSKNQNIIKMKKGKQLFLFAFFILWYVQIFMRL